MMRSIGPQHTMPERALRSFLHRAGFRFRLYGKNLVGKPDLVLPMYRTVMFVHGCFWHQHDRCANAVMPSSNASFWKKKLEANRQRDKIQIAVLRAAGWRVGILWECAARKGVPDARTFRSIAIWLKQRSGYREFPRYPLRSRRN